MSEFRRRLLMSKKERPLPEGAVDLGLPSGTLWHKYNLGASSETGYGDFYMWGSTTPDTNKPCDWAHTPFNNGSSSYNETYFNAHKSEWLDSNVLKPQYDAAHVQLGEDWRMPTEADCNELIANTTSAWVTNYKGSGVNGRTFTSKTNGNSIFIPVAGYRYGSSVYEVGRFAYLWSSTLDLSYDGSDIAYSIRFYLVYASVNSDVRNYGSCIRPVCKP